MRRNWKQKKKAKKSEVFSKLFFYFHQAHVCARKVADPVDVFKILSKSPLKKLIAAQLQITKVEADGFHTQKMAERGPTPKRGGIIS
jgi:hypothetical protein